MSKNWYVEVLLGNKRLAKKYTGINAGKTPEQRRKNAAKLIRSLKKEERQIPACIDERERIYSILESERPNYRKKTFQTYKSKVDVFFRWLGMRSLTQKAMADYFADYRQAHSQSGTSDCRIKLLAVFKKAGLGHLIEPIKIKKGQATPLRYFQKHQRRQLLSYMQDKDPELFLHCMFVYFTGIRPRSELVKVKIGDIFWEKKKVAVHGNFSKNHKTEYVGLARSFMPYILHLQTMPPRDYIFPGKLNPEKPASYNYFGEKFRKVLDGFGYGRDYQLYSWKHTGAVEVYQKTKNLIALQRWARHADVRTTQLYLRQLGIEDFEDFYEEFPAPF